MILLPDGHPPRRLLLVFGLVLLGLIGVGRLAMEAWMVRPAPRTLPEIGARTEEAAPFLLVIVDGLREASAWAEHEPPMPWLRSFAEGGAWGTAIAGEPTLTAPCVRTLLTGRRPDLLTGFRNFNARPVRGSIVGYLHARGAITAHGGDAAAFQFCRDHYEPERVLQFPDQGPTDQGQNDAKAVPHVLEQIGLGADCVTLHLTGPDHAGHKWGATGREYWTACRTVDDQIRTVVEAFLARHPDATVLVAADHGVSAMGTHGGGEASAKRSPFVLVGPDVARVHMPSVAVGARLDQSALAPTVCCLLGLPQPPLADAPPEPGLLDLPEAIETRALEAYVQARLAVARDLHGDAVDVIERKRAEQSVRELAASVNLFLLPNSTGHATGALLLAAIWLVVLVSLVSLQEVPRTAPWRVLLVGGLLALGTFLCMFDPLPAQLPVTPPVAGGIVFLGCALAAWSAGMRTLTGGAITAACLAAMPALTGGGITIQETFTRATDAPASAGRLWIAGLGTVVVLAAFLRPRRLLGRLGELARGAPGLVAAFGGVVIGFTLTLRPFIDPHVHVMILYAAAGYLVVWLMLLSPSAQARPGWERIVLALVGLVLFVATRIAEGVAGEVWVNTTPMRDLGWLLVGALLVAALLLIVAMPLRALSRQTWRGAVGALPLVLVVLAMACVLRADRGALWDQAVALPEALRSLDVVLGPTFLPVLLLKPLGQLHPAYVALLLRNGPAFLALGWTLRWGSADGRLLVRLVAGVALARQLAVADAEFAVFALAAVGAALAARMRLPTSRAALAWLAVGVLALRTAIFHAMGFEESFSTLDVGQAFAGLETTEMQPLDAAGAALVTPQIVVAGLQLALRMALPWVLIVAALARASERAGGGGDRLRCILGDLAVCYGARGAAIAVALWAWWRNSWWMTHAYTVYAYAAADVLLLLLCAALCGAFRGARLRPVPGDGKMAAWSA